MPFVDTPYRVYLGGTSDRTYTLAAERGWGVAVPPLLPYKVLEQQLDLYRSSCAEHGTEPDIVWIHACHLDEDRETALREGRDWINGFIQGNCSPLTEYEKPPTEELDQGRLRLLRRRDHGVSSPRCRTSSSIEDDYVWVGTPDDVIARIEETLAGVRGHPGDRDHRQRGRCAALDGDQEPGALRASR